MSTITLDETQKQIDLLFNLVSTLQDAVSSMQQMEMRRLEREAEQLKAKP